MNSIKYDIKIDRPIGYVDRYGNRYPINYGYIPDIIAGDGEEQDVYVLDIDYAVDRTSKPIIAIIKRKDDIENKWVAADKEYTKEQIWEHVQFLERHFDSEIEIL